MKNSPDRFSTPLMVAALAAFTSGCATTQSAQEEIAPPLPRPVHTVDDAGMEIGRKLLKMMAFCDGVTTDLSAKPYTPGDEATTGRAKQKVLFGKKREAFDGSMEACVALEHPYSGLPRDEGIVWTARERKDGRTRNRSTLQILGIENPIPKEAVPNADGETEGNDGKYVIAIEDANQVISIVEDPTTGMIWINIYNVKMGHVEKSFLVGINSKLPQVLAETRERASLALTALKRSAEEAQD